MTPIKVPDLEAPVVKLCWKQDPCTLIRCDRAEHSELVAHTWEMIRIDKTEKMGNLK